MFSPPLHEALLSGFKAQGLRGSTGMKFLGVSLGPRDRDENLVKLGALQGCYMKVPETQSCRQLRL